MLVLTRRTGEEIIIAGTIRIELLEVHGERVRIGVSAPPSIRVDRAEIHEQRSKRAVGGNNYVLNLGGVSPIDEQTTFGTPLTVCS